MSAKFADYSHVAFDLIEKLAGLRTPQQVVSRMSSALAQFGFSGFLVSTTPEPRAARQRQTFLDGWPNQFNQYYIEKEFYKDDPVVARCLSRDEPFEWSDAPFDRDRHPRAQEVMDAARSVGLKNGFAVPIFRGPGLIDTVTMGGDYDELDSGAKRAIHLVALYAHSKALSVGRTGEAPRLIRRALSPAEREALSWTAAGKTTWEISVILGVSEAAIAKRIKLATRKLGSANKTQAVVEAIRTKQINI
jgi:LuxR family quorum sensing-dependent transcriptional regulator